MGAAACIVTRWKINLRSSREILRAMYVRWLQEGLPRAIALQKAQQYMLDHQEVTAYHHPYHWAPFILVGNWY
jgi:CHAT domain-containing protein